MKTEREEFMKSSRPTYTEHLEIADADILFDLHQNRFVNQRVLSENTGHSLGVVNQSLRRLIEHGYLNNENRLTSKALKTFEEKSPRNAIILAAGFGMRMVPINFTNPKAFLEVNGERLIERIIKQLHEVGIKDITVVVGFMKDAFEYLIDEFEVKLAYAKDYSSTNNLHSLSVVADILDNTYIIPCDLWCDVNPFRKYELHSWYMVSDTMDEASDVRLNRKMELVRIPNNATGNRMIGIAYLNGEEAKIVSRRVRDYSTKKNYDDKFWEEALYTKDRMIVKARVERKTVVAEINTYEELRELDSQSNQLKSDALQTIANALECTVDNIVDIEVLKKGMTNRSFLFRITEGKNKGKYIMRIPGEGTDQLIDRKAEAYVYEIIRGKSFCDDPLYIDAKNGYKITKYIEGVRCCNPEKLDDLKRSMNKLREFHNYTVDGQVLSVPHTFDLFERVEFYESLWEGKSSIYSDYKKTKSNCRKLITFIEKHKEPFQLTHIDAVPDNFLFEPSSKGDYSIQLTDWEYAGMQDKHVDVAMFCIYSMYDKEQIDRLIDIYFEEDGGCDNLTRAKIYCYISICGLIWSNWCEYKRNLGVEFGEYSLYQYRYGKDYFKYATSLMEEIGEPIEGR